MALVDTLAKRDSFMISHVWNETDRVVKSIDQYLDIYRRGSCHAHLSHLKVGGQQNLGGFRGCTRPVRRCCRTGPAGHFRPVSLHNRVDDAHVLLPPWVHQGDSEAIRHRLNSAAVRDHIAADISRPGDLENLAYASGSWDNILITRTGSGHYQGDTIADIAAEMGREPVGVMCEYSS